MNDDPDEPDWHADADEVYERFKGDPNFMLSLARGLRVISAFSERRIPMNIAELSRVTHLDRAVVKRCLYTLVNLGMAEVDGKKFSLSPGILVLGHAYFSSSKIVERSQPYLDQLGNKIYANCALAILSGREVVYLSRFQGKRLIQKNIGLGSRLPAYCTSVGRVLLSGLAPAELDIYLESALFQRYTEFTVTDKLRLREIIEEVRREGYSIVDQELEIGLAAIAVPVYMAHSQTKMALSVTVSSKYVAAHELKELYLEKMKDLAIKLPLVLY